MNWRDNPLAFSRCFARGALRVALACSLLGLGTGFVEAKTRSKTKKERSPSAEASPSATPDKNTIDIPIPVDHAAKGVRIPLYNVDGKLQMLLESEVAFRADLQQLQLTRLKIATFDEEGNPELSVDMPQSTFNLKTRVLTSTEPVTLRRSDLELVGGNMVFDTQTRQGKFTGPVRMLIYKETQEAEKPTGE